jgi:hypothetical protein
MERVNADVSRQLPQTRRTSYGRIKVMGMALYPSDGNATLDILAKFILTSYEIPEGIEGMVSYTGGLGYDPAQRRLRLQGLRATKLTFANPSLEEYISTSARKGIPRTVASVLQGLTLQQMPEGFRAKRVRKFTIQNDQLMVDFD